MPCAHPHQLPEHWHGAFPPTSWGPVGISYFFSLHRDFMEPSIVVPHQSRDDLSSLPPASPAGLWWLWTAKQQKEEEGGQALNICTGATFLPVQPVLHWPLVIKESKNHRLVWVGRNIKHHPVPSPCHGYNCHSLDQAAQGLIWPGLLRASCASPSLPPEERIISEHLT